MNLAEELESLIRSGKFDEVEHRLLNLGKIKRPDAVVFANIARRVKRLHLAAKILNPIVRSEDRLQAPATALEKIEYADTLRQLGAVAEARELLGEIDATQYPQAFAYLGFCMMNEWRYNEAYSYLSQYIQQPNIPAYDRTVAQVNIAAALISTGQLSEADELLKKLREETQKSNLMLLYGNCLELTAQMFILKHELERALKYLNESSEILKRAGQVVGLFVEKWIAIAKSLKANQVLPELEEVFAKAQAACHWETIRDCDLYLAFLRQDFDRFRLVYFGTPYLSFRERVVRFAGDQFQIPSTYLWSPSKAPKYFLDITTGQVSGATKTSLPPGQALHRLLISLCQDFYRPLSVMKAFGQLFPDEHMNSITSANRVHQVVKRCREWMVESNLPMQIDESDGTYKLVLGEEMGILVPLCPMPLLKEEIELLILQNIFGSKVFKASDLEDVFSRSASVNRILLRWGIENGRIEKSGDKKNTAYRILPVLRRAKAG